MAKCLAVAFAALLLGGCGDAPVAPPLDSDAEPSEELFGSGEFLVPQEDLPKQVVELANTIGGMPRISSTSNFESALTRSGLNRKPDHYKDFQHFWYLDANFEPAKLDTRAYLVSMGYTPDGNSNLAFYDAGIYRELSSKPWRETLWQIKYAK